MPGSTPNSNILDALDELIKSINDLTNRPIIVQCGGCGCGGESGINPPIPPETDGTQPPPTGYKPPVLVDNRFCKAAAYLYFQELEILQKLDQYDVPSLALGSITRTVALVTWILTGFGGGVGLALAARLGTISEIVESFLNPIDLENLINGWIGCKDNIICAMITLGGSSDSAENIHNAIWGILEDYGVSLPNRIVYSNVFTIELIALLWYSDYDERFEQDFIEWELPGDIDCGCGMVYLASFVECVSHETENGGTSYPPVIENENNATGQPDGETAHFVGSYYVEIIYSLGETITGPANIITTATITNADWRQIWVNPAIGANWDDNGWVLAVSDSLSGSYSGTSDIGTVKFKLYANIGFNADILLDGCSVG